ncbi:class I SAM-dependent methyltransferase [Castellaniella sp.]|uniref:class I SAM-dependent methyltransferase n=1 Tax=Castellaniella sp. TaxID=1955812 RepID=UPI00355F5294
MGRVFFEVLSVVNEYWKNHYNAKVEKFRGSPLKQVERTVNGQEMDQGQIDLTIGAIARALRLTDSDMVADLCCGNGLITRVMARKAGRIRAVDISDQMVDYAREFSAADNVDYLTADVSRLPASFFEGCSKAYICDSISCLESDDLVRLLEAVHGAASVQTMYISGIPDHDQLASYYDTEEKMAYYRKQKASGTPHIGNWWTREQFRALVEATGFRATILSQGPERMSAYFRFDCLVERP